MAFPKQHEMHRRRFSRNLGLGLVLAGFVVLMMALTVVKVTRENAQPMAESGMGTTP
jgi:hypothetical protein